MNTVDLTPLITFDDKTYDRWIRVTTIHRKNDILSCNERFLTVFGQMSDALEQIKDYMGDKREARIRQLIFGYCRWAYGYWSRSMSHPLFYVTFRRIQEIAEMVNNAPTENRRDLTYDEKLIEYVCYYAFQPKYMDIIKSYFKRFDEEDTNNPYAIPRI